VALLLHVEINHYRTRNLLELLTQDIFVEPGRTADFDMRVEKYSSTHRRFNGVCIHHFDADATSCEAMRDIADNARMIRPDKGNHNFAAGRFICLAGVRYGYMNAFRGKSGEADLRSLRTIQIAELHPDDPCKLLGHVRHAALKPVAAGIRDGGRQPVYKAWTVIRDET